MTEKKNDGLLANLFAYTVIILICALLMGGVSALWYVFLSPAFSSRYGRSKLITKAVMEDNSSKMKTRFYVGTGFGVIIGIGVSIAVRKKMKEV